jgi:peptide/nickel transport system substrate-binding protein
MSKLITLDKKNVFQPDLAESWEVSADGKTYTFDLRKDVKWHDGESFTSEDVSFTYHAALLPDAGSTWSSWAKSIVGGMDYQEGKTEAAEGIKVLDDYTIQFDLNDPSAEFLPVFVAAFWVMPAHPFEGIDDPAEWLKLPVATEKPIGTGPFKMTEYVVDQHIIFDRFDDYFLGPPLLEQCIIRFYGDASVMLIGLDKGEIDCTMAGLDPEDYERLSGNPDFVLDPVNTGSTVFVSLSFTRDFLQDKRVRQAFLYAIDREGLVREVLNGLGSVPKVSMWQADWANSPNLEPYPYDPEKAKALLQDAGWDSSRELEAIWFGEQMADHIPIIQQQLAAVGINIKLVQTENARIMNIFYETGDYDVCFLGGYGGKAPWGNYSTLGCDQPYPAGWNSMHYCNEEMDQLLLDVVKETERAKQAEMFQRASEIFNEDVPYVPLYIGLSYWIYNKKVKGWEAETSGQWNWWARWDVWNWYVEE